eukprot:14775632-Alexandrium_andersonii.AAC.1
MENSKKWMQTKPSHQPNVKFVLEEGRLALCAETSSPTPARKPNAMAGGAEGCWRFSDKRYAQRRPGPRNA